MITFAVKTDNIKIMYCKRDARIELLHNIVECYATKLKHIEAKIEQFAKQYEDRIVLLEEEIKYLTDNIKK